jgi:hypothetical protein
MLNKRWGYVCSYGSHHEAMDGKTFSLMHEIKKENGDTMLG